MPLSRIHSFVPEPELKRLKFMMHNYRKVLQLAETSILVEEYSTYDFFSNTNFFGTFRICTDTKNNSGRILKESQLEKPAHPRRQHALQLWRRKITLTHHQGTDNTYWTLYYPAPGSQGPDRITNTHGADGNRANRSS